MTTLYYYHHHLRFLGLKKSWPLTFELLFVGFDQVILVR